MNLDTRVTICEMQDPQISLHIYDRACENRPCERKKNHRFLACLLYHNFITTYLYYWNKIFITTAEFNKLSSAAYRIGIVHSERKILVKI